MEQHFAFVYVHLMTITYVSGLYKLSVFDGQIEGCKWFHVSKVRKISTVQGLKCLVWPLTESLGQKRINGFSKALAVSVTTSLALNKLMQIIKLLGNAR